MALRALEFCLHCLDASPWPFTLDEVLQNYALAVEAPERFLWQRGLGRAGLSAYSGGASYSLEATNSLPPSSPVRLTLLRLQVGSHQTASEVEVRWIRGLEMEAAFWRTKLSFTEENASRLSRPLKILASGEPRAAAPLVGHRRGALDTARRRPLQPPHGQEAARAQRGLWAAGAKAPAMRARGARRRRRWPRALLSQGV